MWVDGELTRFLGQQGGSVISGWNAPNRLVIGRNVKPGQKIQLAVFGINGPISNPPTNFIWVRYAKLDFYASGLDRGQLRPYILTANLRRLYSGKNLDFPSMSGQNSLRNDAASDVFPQSPKGLEGVRPVPIVTACSEIVEYPLYTNPTTRSWKRQRVFSQKGHPPSTAQREFPASKD